MEDYVFRRTTLLLETNSLMQEYANRRLCEDVACRLLANICQEE